MLFAFASRIKVTLKEATSNTIERMSKGFMTLKYSKNNNLASSQISSVEAGVYIVERVMYHTWTSKQNTHGHQNIITKDKSQQKETTTAGLSCKTIERTSKGFITLNIQKKTIRRVTELKLNFSRGEREKKKSNVPHMVIKTKTHMVITTKHTWSSKTSSFLLRNWPRERKRSSCNLE